MRNGFTTPPKRYTEDTLLSAMENAGTEGTEAEAEAERKGLGTPATRAGIIEKMVKTGFAQRKGKQLVPMAKGQNLVAILPEQIKSPMLTSEWEYQLSQIEKGILPQADFLASIGALTHELVKNNAEPNPEYCSEKCKKTGQLEDARNRQKKWRNNKAHRNEL